MVYVVYGITQFLQTKFCESSLFLAFSCSNLIIRLFVCFAVLQLHGVDDAIDKSKKILSAMSKRMSRNKWIVGSVIAALVFAIILILYFKLSH